MTVDDLSESERATIERYNERVRERLSKFIGEPSTPETRTAIQKSVADVSRYYVKVMDYTGKSMCWEHGYVEHLRGFCNLCLAVLIPDKQERRRYRKMLRAQPEGTSV